MTVLQTSSTPPRISSRSVDFVQRHAVLLSVIGASLFLVVAHLLMAWQPLTTDDNDYFVTATQWQQHRQMVVHPQLYVHFLQLMLALFGKTAAAARLTTLLPNLLTVMLIPWLVWLVYADSVGYWRQRAIAVLAVWLYALSPLTVQNTALVDNDAGILIVAMLLLLAFWFASSQMASWQRILLLGAWLGLCFWLKLTTPPMAVTAIFGYSLLRGRWRDALVAIGFGLVGVLLFVATHLVYSTFTGYTLADATSGVRGRLGGGASIIDWPAIFQSAGIYLLWLTLLLSVLFATTIVQSIGRYLRRAAARQDLLILYSAIVIVVYVFLQVPAWGYPRYQSPALPTVMIVTAALVVAAQQRFSRRVFWLGVLVASVTALLLGILVGDPLYGLYASTFATTSSVERLQAALAGIATPLVIMALIGGGAFVWARWRGESALPLLLATAIALVIGAYLALDVVQVGADYSTRFRYTYRYADRQAAIDWVDTSIPENGYVLADKDILWFVSRPGEQINPYLIDPTTLVSAITTRRVDAIAWAQKEWLKAPAAQNDAVLNDLLSRCYVERTFGIFTVLLRKDAGDGGCDLP